MRRALLLLPVLLACGKRAPTEAPAPLSPRGPVVDTYFGVEVPDPYRWLEDLDSAETVAWVQAQNALTRRHLDALPHRGRLAERLAALWTYGRWSAPVRRGDRLFYEHNDGTRDHAVLMVDDGDGARVLLDPNTLSADGTVSLAGWSVSEDGARLAYGVADAGSDWRTWRVRDVGTGVDTGDEVRWVKFSGAEWLHDGAGFVYGRYDEPGEAFEERLAHQKLYYHRLGTPQSDDVLVHWEPDQPEWGYDHRVSDDGRRLWLQVTQGTEERSRIWYLDLADLDLDAAGGAAGVAPTRLLDAFDANYVIAGEDARHVYLFTDLDAPRGRVIAIDPARPEREAWREVIPEDDATLTGARLLGGHLVLQYLADASSLLRVHTLDGAHVRDVPLPGIGTVPRVEGTADATDLYFGFTSFTTPPSVYRHDLLSGRTEAWRSPTLGFDPADYETTQVTFTSRDGTQVPMFLSHRRGLAPDGDRPVLLYGYGGFNIPITPGFKVPHLVWMELGGVYASVNLRGGGEFGRAWHEAGTKLQKQNVFDDFIGAAEHLVDAGWTRPARLAIHGRSNGGLLVGATLVQRPDLFGAAIPSVGVLDMLRYHTFTIGWAWASDYGTSAESEEMFRALLAYSPVHNARPAPYPPTLITTADHDDRVVPGHSYKFAAALQHAQRGDAPILIRIETRAGHGAGTPVSMLVQEEADKLGFLVDALGVQLP